MDVSLSVAAPKVSLFLSLSLSLAFALQDGVCEMCAMGSFGNQTGLDSCFVPCQNHRTDKQCA